MREIGKGDDAQPTHPRRLAQHDLGIAQVLERVDLQHDVERRIVEHRQALVEIELQHVDAAAHALEHVAIGDLHAIAGAAALALQQVEQRAVAAAQVEHARALGHEAGDEPLDAGVAHRAAPASSSRATRSK